jgi:hypothetical protein
MQLFKAKPQAIQPTRTESLACIPQKNPAVTWQNLEKGELRLEYPLNIQAFFINLAISRQKKPNSRPTKKLQLDKLGGMVWNLVDGKNTVAGIIKEFSSSSGLSLAEAEISVTAFLRDLGRRGLIFLS